MIKSFAGFSSAARDHKRRFQDLSRIKGMALSTEVVPPRFFGGIRESHLCQPLHSKCSRLAEEFRCRYACGYVAQNVPSLLNHLYSEHEGALRSVCPLCPAQFKKKVTFDKHQAFHRRSLLICEYCNHKYYTQDGLDVLYCAKRNPVPISLRDLSRRPHFW